MELQSAGKLYAEWIWPNVTKEQKNLISFGMTDAELADDAKRYIRRELALAFCRINKYDDAEAPYWEKHIKEDQIDHFVKGFIIGLMEQRKMEGLMVA